MLHTMRKLFSRAVLFGLLAVLLVVTPVLASAAPAPATGMTNAAGPLPGWVEVAPGATQWYRFKYSYDNSDKDNEPTQAIVELNMRAPGNLVFEVWTPERLRAPLPSFTEDKDEENGMVREPVGVGTPRFLYETWHWEGMRPQHKHYVDVVDRMDLIWAGGARATDTYYVVVKNKGETPASYHLTITGPDVSF